LLDSLANPAGGFRPSRLYLPTLSFPHFRDLWTKKLGKRTKNKFKDICASFMQATRRAARARSEFHSYLLHAVILIKPRDFVLGTVADIRALYCVEN
jgi:hypothetical protein